MAVGDVFPLRGMPGQTAENWARSAEDRIIELEKLVESLSQSVAGSNRALASQIAMFPGIVSDNWRNENFGLGGSFANVVSGTITVPPGKVRASILAVGTGSAVDATTGGLTTAYGRCVIAGVAGGSSPAAKDAGASQVNNVITATHALTFGVTPGTTLSVAFQMYGLNGSAYPVRPTNFGQIAVVATFT